MYEPKGFLAIFPATRKPAILRTVIPRKAAASASHNAAGGIWNETLAITLYSSFFTACRVLKMDLVALKSYAAAGPHHWSK